MNLYNKYRPKKFVDTVQPTVIPILMSQINNNKTVGSYLFEGYSGIGKTTIARIFAMALLCPNVQGGEPCGECEYCQLVINSRHPDVVEHNCAVSGGVEQIREEIISTMRVVPMYGQYRIYILDEAQLLTVQSQNALLKTMEEPPPYVKFIIATTEPNKIINTIKTRCQRYKLLLLSNKDNKQILKKIVQLESIVHDDLALQMIAESSAGSARDAISLLDQLQSIGVTEENVRNILGRTSKQLAIDLLISIANGKRGEVLQTIETINNNGQNVYNFVEDMVFILLQVAKIKLNIIENQEILKDVIEKYKGLYLQKVLTQLLEILKVKNVSSYLIASVYLLDCIDIYKKIEEGAKLRQTP